MMFPICVCLGMFARHGVRNDVPDMRVGYVSGRKSVSVLWLQQLGQVRLCSADLAMLAVEETGRGSRFAHFESFSLF
jgi:hypothetical protein